jgi:hypothetical protein
MTNFEDSFPQDPIDTKAPHSGLLPENQGRELPAVEQPGPLEGEQLRIPDDVSALTIAQQAAKIAQLERGKQSHTLRNSLIAGGVLAVAATGVGVGIAVGKGSSNEAGPTTPLGDEPSVVTSANIPPTHDTLNPTTNSITLPSTTAPEQTTPTTEQTVTTSVESTLPAEMQKYEVNTKAAEADPDAFFANMAQNLGMKPAFITDKQEAQLKSFEAAGQYQDAGKLLGELQNPNFQAFVNTIATNRDLSPKLREALDKQFMKYLMFGGTDPKSLKQNSLYNALTDYAEALPKNTIVTAEVYMYADIPADSSTAEEQSIVVNLQRKNVVTGEADDPLDPGYVKVVIGGMTVGTPANGLGDGTQKQALFF